MSSQTIATLAREALEHFETRHRDDGTEYIATRTAEVPAWLASLVRDAHHEILPDDFRYALIRDALSYAADAPEGLSDDDWTEIQDEFADDVDIYTSQLLAWLSSHAARPGYCDEAREELGSPADKSLMGRVSAGQWFERREVFASVLQSLRDELEARDDA